MSFMYSLLLLQTNTPEFFQHISNQFNIAVSSSHAKT